MYKSIKYTLKENEGDYYVADFTGYVGNIELIGTKSFTLYTYVMGKMVKVKVNYSDCELVVD